MIRRTMLNGHVWNLAVLAVALTMGMAVTASAQTIVINEVDYDATPGDDQEFIEIYNNGVSAVDLGPFEVQVFISAGSLQQTIDLPAETLAAGDYFTICDSTAAFFATNCDMAFPSVLNIDDGGCGFAIVVSGVGTIVDSASFEVSIAGITEGSPGPADSNSTPTSVCRTPDGQDSNDNSVDFTSQTTTPDTGNVPVELMTFAVE